MSKSSAFQKFGITGLPLRGSMVLIKDMPYFATLTPPIQAVAAIVWDCPRPGWMTGVNIYGGETGSSYDATKYASEVPGPKEKKRLKKLREYTQTGFDDPRLGGVVLPLE